MSEFNNNFEKDKENSETSEDMRRGLNPDLNPKNRNNKKLIIIIIAVIAFVFVILGVFFGLSQFKAPDPDSEEITTIEIAPESSNSDIATLLEEEDLIKSTRAFMFYSKISGGAYQAGIYDLSPSMDLNEISSILTEGSNATEKVKIVIPEGKTLEQIAEIIAEAIGSDPEEVFAQLNDEVFIKEMQAMFPELLTDEIFAEGVRYPLEGYLFPATYTFYVPNPTVEDIVIDMLTATEYVVDQYRDDMPEGMTVHEMLTMASIVERECNSQTDRAMVAGVYYNRLEIGMPLQSDITVLYAQGEHKSTVNYDDLEYDDPYNTYEYEGLPPGPIASPGEAAIQAAIYPTDSEYFYYVTDENGVGYFAETYEEHEANIDKYLK